MTARHPAGYIAAEDAMTAHDEEPNVLYARALGPDPWLPWTCQGCGSINTAGMPAKCDGCGLRNFGEGS